MPFVRFQRERVSKTIRLSLSHLYHLVWEFLFPALWLGMALFGSYFMAEECSILHLYNIYLMQSSVHGHSVGIPDWL